MRSPLQFAEGSRLIGGYRLDKLIEHGLYSVNDSYFRDFKRPYWVDNKNEHRPYYYLIQDRDGIDWVIPMSSQVDNYKRKIERIEAKRGVGNCVYYHLGVIASKESVFLIGDMFPINYTYIKAPYTMGPDYRHYIVHNKRLNAALYSKAMRYLKLIETGVMKSRNDIMGIKQVLLKHKER